MKPTLSMFREKYFPDQNATVERRKRQISVDRVEQQVPRKRQRRNEDPLERCHISNSADDVDNSNNIYQHALATVLHTRTINKEKKQDLRSKEKVRELKMSVESKSEFDVLDLAKIPLCIPTGDCTTPPKPEDITPPRRQRRRAGKRVQRSLRKKLMDSKISEKDEDRETDIYSPIQGYVLKVKNISSTVTEDNLIDLFSRVGAVGNVQSGSYDDEAKVTFVKRACCMAAIDKYDGKVLGDKAIKVEPHSVPPVPNPIGYEWREKIRAQRPRDRRNSVGKIEIDVPSFAFFNSDNTANVTFNVTQNYEHHLLNDDLLSDYQPQFMYADAARNDVPVELVPKVAPYMSNCLIPKRK